MAMINVSGSDKDIEFTSLEAHVGLCNQRQQALELKINSLVEQHKEYRKMIFRACIALVTGGLSGLSALLIHLSGKLL